MSLPPQSKRRVGLPVSQRRACHLTRASARLTASLATGMCRGPSGANRSKSNQPGGAEMTNRSRPAAVPRVNPSGYRDSRHSHRLHTSPSRRPATRPAPEVTSCKAVVPAISHGMGPPPQSVGTNRSRARERTMPPAGAVHSAGLFEHNAIHPSSWPHDSHGPPVVHVHHVVLRVRVEAQRGP